MQQRRFPVKLGLALLWAVCLFGFAGAAAALEVGATPPDFELPALNGSGVVRLSEYRGRPIVLKIATTWCPSCKAQVKELAAARKALEEHQAVVIEIYVDEPVADVQADLSAHPHDYPSVVAVDDGRVARAYSMWQVPRVLLIDRDFKVRRDRSLIEAGDLAAKLAKMEPAQ